MAAATSAGPIPMRVAYTSAVHKSRATSTSLAKVDRLQIMGTPRTGTPIEVRSARGEAAVSRAIHPAANPFRVMEDLGGHSAEPCCASVAGRGWLNVHDP
jgi:hypothetical protein